MKHILIDTDVLFDFFLDREPFSKDAAHVLSFCETGEVKGFVTPVIISNLYYLLCQNAKKEPVLDSIKKLMFILDILVIDKNAVVLVIHSSFKDFEDALQNYAAEAHGSIDMIITRNSKDYRASK